MKLFLLSLFTLVLSLETFAQHRPGERRDPRDPRHDNRPTIPPRQVPGGHRFPPTPPPVIVRPGRPGRPVGPRYNPNPNRGYRNNRRVIVWGQTPGYVQFTYACNSRNVLYFQQNGYATVLHDFVFSTDCQQAIHDIRATGDFCDGADLYDRSGRLEARFSYSHECRNALGWYY